MARKIRIEYAGAVYHIMARGNQGRDIYDDDRDHKLWLETLGEACQKTGWRIHAWVSGEAKRAHSEAEAERLLGCGLAALELEGRQLAAAKKGAWEKEVLAWWLCQHTTARRRWVSERLGMGDESRVTRAIGRVRRDGSPELERLKSRLEQVYYRNLGELEAGTYSIFRDPFRA